jgi:hypothetical protein
VLCRGGAIFAGLPAFFFATDFVLVAGGLSVPCSFSASLVVLDLAGLSCSGEVL